MTLKEVEDVMKTLEFEREYNEWLTDLSNELEEVEE